MKSKTEKSLYFIALIPPEPVFTEAQRFKEYFAEHHQSKAALKSPPHITLHMPFRLKPQKEEALIEALAYAGKNMEAAPLDLDGFCHFNQRVIYIKVKESEKLESLFNKLIKTLKVNFNIFNADYKERGFHPHLTVAFRDLKKDEFKKAWPSFKDRPFSYTFNCTQFSLLKHNGKYWELFKDFELEKG